MPHLLQASSQSLSKGQTRAQEPPKTLFSRMVSAAPLGFRNLIDRMNLAGSVPAGQPALHGASWHNKHREASSMAVRCVKPATASVLYLSVLTLLNTLTSF
jgi:hypothetical protein